MSTEDANQKRGAIRGLGNAILKGTLTQDKKKLVTHFLCGATAEVARKLPENDENTPLDVRIVRALLSNSDVHSYYVKLWVDQRFKAPPLQPIAEASSDELQMKIQVAQGELIQKEAGVESAFIYLDDKQDDYDRNYHKDKYHKKLKGGIKNYNQVLAERDAAFNKLAELYGSPERATTKPIKIPKKAGNWEKAKLWINRNVAGSGEMSIGSIPLYETKTPNRSDRTILNPQTQKPTPNTPQKPTTQYSANIGQWEGIQEQQTQQIFNMNMAYRPPSVEPQLALAQQPRLLQAGFAPVENDFVKSIPKGALKAFGGVLKMLTPLMSNKGAECSKEHLKRVITHLVQKYDKAVKIKNPDSFASKSGEVAGEMLALGAVGKVIRVAEGVSLFATASEGGLYGAIIAEAHDTNKFAGVAFGFAGGGVGHCVGGVVAKIAKPTPLTDRALMPNPVYHSGFHPMGEMFHLNPTLSAKELNGLKDLSKTIQATKTINRSKNCQVVIWSEKGAVRTAPIREMSHAGTFHDRGGISKAGRALDKHGQRIDTVFPKAVGSIHEKNIQGQKVLDEILNHPDKKICFKKMRSLKYQDCIDIKLPDGRGARFSRDGKEFITFLEPNK